MGNKKTYKFGGRVLPVKLGPKPESSTDWKALQEQTDEFVVKNAATDPMCQPTDALFWKSATREGRWSMLRLITRDVRVQDKELYAALGIADNSKSEKVLIYVAYTKFTDPMTKKIVVTIEAARKATSVERLVWMTQAKK